MMKLADGTEIEPIPVGATVRHKKHGFIGKVMAHEFCKPGLLSAIPYKVYWDGEEADRVLGWFSIYQVHENLEVVSL